MSSDKDSVECIVLKYTEYKDNTYIINLLTKEHGVIAVSSKISKRSKIRGAYLYPLARLDCNLTIRPSREIHTINDCTLRGSANNTFNPANAMIKMFLAEIIQNTTKAQTNDISLFNFIESSIAQLDESTGNTLNFHLIFLIQYTRLLGFYPNIENFSHDSKFDLENATFVANTPIHNLFLTEEQTITFVNLLRASYNTMHLFELSRTQRNETLNYMMEYYKLHLPEFKEPKSLDVFRNL